MFLLILGLIVFFGPHSTRIWADPWRSAQIGRIGPGAWKGLYSLLSIAGLTMIVIGYGAARKAPIVLFTPPAWTQGVAAVLTLAAFVLLAASFIPGTRIKATVGHPMVLGVKVWALAHLLANGTLADVLLFGSFLVWAIFNFRASRQRDSRANITYPAGPTSRDVMAVVIGAVTWVVFAFWLHGWMIGVQPFA